MVQQLMALFRATVSMFAPFASTSMMIHHALNCFPHHFHVALVNIYVWHQSLAHLIVPHFVRLTRLHFLLSLLFYCIRIYHFYFCILFYSNVLESILPSLTLL